MTIAITQDALRKIFPKAPPAVVAAFIAKQDVLSRAGVNHTRKRLAYAFAQVEHECSGFTRMRENVNYSAARAVQVWPSRFHSEADCYAKVGSYPGDPEFRTKLIDHVYGGRMGNRPGTHDGSLYIGRGGPMVTGRDGYLNVDKHSGLNGRLALSPQLAETADIQPELIAGFVSWKGLNAKADLGDFRGYVKIWNGGVIGFADREAQLAGNDPFIGRLENVKIIAPIAQELPGNPPTAEPPKDAIDAATSSERKSRAGGVAGAAGGAGNEGAKQTGTIQPDKAPLSSPVAYTLIAIGIAVAIVATILIARKVAIIKANWK